MSERPLIDRLHNARVLWAERIDGGVSLWESCDGYFSEELTADDVENLCRELLSLLEPRHTITEKGKAMVKERK